MLTKISNGMARAWPLNTDGREIGNIGSCSGEEAKTQKCCSNARFRPTMFSLFSSRAWMVSKSLPRRAVLRYSIMHYMATLCSSSFPNSYWDFELFSSSSMHYMADITSLKIQFCQILVYVTNLYQILLLTFRCCTCRHGS